MSFGSAQEVNVKCRAMYARLLDRSEYNTLLQIRSVSQIADYLKKQTPYAYVLRRIDKNDVHRGQLEQVFKRSLFYDYERLLKFTTGGYREAIRAMFESFEVEDLKHIIGSVCSAQKQALTLTDLTYMRTYSEFPISSLLEADTMEDLVANLVHTRYYKALLPFAVREDPDFFKIDHALNLLNYTSKLVAFRQALSGAGRRIATSLYRTQVDIENILFIYRIKKLYHFTASEILVNLLPNAYKLSNHDLLRMAECEGIDELTDAISRTEYGPLFPKGRESEWETLHAEHFYWIHKKNLRTHSGDIGVVLAYLYLKEIDVKNIIMIIEGVRYQLPTERIASFLIGSVSAPNTSVA